jgi:lysozyme
MRKLLAPVVAAAIIGAGGLALIKNYEGLRYSSYADPVGIPTICYGHTGPEVRLGQRATQEQCDTLLMQDIAKHQRVLIGPRNCIASVPLTGNQLDALTSLTFNIGGAKFCGSTLAAKLRLRDYTGAAAEFRKWDRARIGGVLKPLPGLTRRRGAEAALFRMEPHGRTEGPPGEALRTLTLY